MAGKTVRIKAGIVHPQVENFGGSEYRLEDWWDRCAGKSWMRCDRNPACLIYAIRIGFALEPLPNDDEVVYGKVGHLGHLLHVSELEAAESEQA